MWPIRPSGRSRFPPPIVHNPAVRKTRRYLLISLLIAAVGVVSLLILSQPSEPIYQGKPLSYWCEQYAANSFPDSNMELQKQAGIAIRAIGTNAVPTLLRKLQAKDSKIKLKLLYLAQKQDFFHIKWKTADFRHYEARQGLLALGPQAKSALPALVGLYSDTKHRSYGPEEYFNGKNELTAIAQIFASIGPAAADAVPQLVLDTTANNPDLRLNVVFALSQIHARPDLAVPALTKSLRDPSDIVRSIAASGLEAFGTDAKSAVPELVKSLGDPSLSVREEAASALKQIDPEAAAKAGVK
jgi:hypothetical protein